MRVLPLAVRSDFCLHDYLMQRTPKERDENGHLGVELRKRAREWGARGKVWKMTQVELAD